jgi:DNA-binding CsgD family transcriptional regulator/predicted negative regulator of RcsB-dependent stress response
MTAAHCVLGALYLDLLELSMACQHLKQALTLAHEIGSQHWISGSAGFLASASILLNDLAQAESVLTPVLDVDAPAQTIGQRLVWCARAELALARGKPDHALAITDHLLASAANVSPERNILRVSKLRGEVLAALHQRAEAKIALQSAQEIAHAQGARSMQWRISVALGKLYQALHQHEEAEQAFSTAQRIIEELAANIPDESLREHFLASATALIPRTHPLSLLRATKQALSGLTPREREVATLIGRGKSNREIADRLVVSERTVETHVRNVLTKLDFASRTQIAAWAVKKGLVDDQ